jgi:CheY-like chemotaxis protein
VLYPLSYGGSGTSRLAAAHGASGTVVAMSGSLGRVLVVDDDDVIRQLITVNLELEGFEVATAVDGQDCLDKVKDVDPAVVTLDIMMPRMDGWEAASRLRENPETAGVKVVLLSARAQEADLERGSRIGVDAYLTKPFDPDELIATVRRLAGLPQA